MKEVTIEGVLYHVGMKVFDKEMRETCEVIDIDSQHIITDYDMINHSIANEYLTVIAEEEEAEESIHYNSNDRMMKEAGHKQSDFI